MPIPTSELGNLSAKSTKASRIGKDDPLVIEVVKIINETPKYITLTGLAETLHMRGKYLDVKENNLRSRIKRRLDILCTAQSAGGGPALMRKTELRVDAYGETDGSIRHFWFLPEHEDDISGEKVIVSSLVLLWNSTDMSEWFKGVMDDWIAQTNAKLVHDLDGWKVLFWAYIRESMKDNLWLQVAASHLGLEQDHVMYKRVLRSLSPIIDELFETET